MTTSRTDMVYGRRGGGWVPDGYDRPPVRTCDVCGGDMVVGQKRRHYLCSPPMPCCGYPSDLVQDKAKHAKEHEELSA